MTICIARKELEPWVEKIDKIREQTKVLRVYFNNHYGGKAVINALEFKEMLGIKLSEKEASKLENAKSYLGRLRILNQRPFQIFLPLFSEQEMKILGF